jgi:hypothetical protein
LKQKYLLFTSIIGRRGCFVGELRLRSFSNSSPFSIKYFFLTGFTVVVFFFFWGGGEFFSIFVFIIFFLQKQKVIVDYSKVPLPQKMGARVWLAPGDTAPLPHRMGVKVRKFWTKTVIFGGTLLYISH